MFRYTAAIAFAALLSACAADTPATPNSATPSEATSTTVAEAPTPGAPTALWHTHFTIGPEGTSITGTIPVDSEALRLLQGLDTSDLQADRLAEAPAWLAAVLEHLLAAPTDSNLEVDLSASSVTVAGILAGSAASTAYHAELVTLAGSSVEVVFSIRSTFAADLDESNLFVFFGLGSQVPGSNLDEVSRTVVGLLATYPNACLLIIGHTDEQGDGHRELSLARAEAVGRHLIEIGITPNRLRVEGAGAGSPDSPEPDDISYAANRRVAFDVCR